MSAPLALILFAVVAGTFGSRWLHQAAWPERSPKLGVLAWQALSGAVVFAVVLTGLALAMPSVPLTANIAEFLQACVTALRAHYSTPGGAVLSAGGLLLAIGVTARVAYCLGAAFLSASATRRSHRESLALVARRHESHDALVVEHGVAAAYCLPGRGREVVLTTAALEALDEEQIEAVLAHERAHLHGRHELVLAAAAALYRAFPWVPAFRIAHTDLAGLVEMMADDAGARRTSQLTVATALVRLADGSVPAAALAAGGHSAVARVRRLLADPQPLGIVRSALTGVLALSVLMAPAVLLAAPALAAASADYCPVDFPT